MKIFLDTANLDSIRMYNDMGLVDGITTNPSLLAKEGGDPQKTMEEISRIIKGKTHEKDTQYWYVFISG